MAYTQLTSEERHYIETRHKMGDSTTAIAKALVRSQSTVSRELTRNRGARGYRHKQAHAKAQQRHADKPKAGQVDPGTGGQHQYATGTAMEPRTDQRRTERRRQDGCLP
ncbi:helix-turn-helix domain-containing protein [Thiothrix nivea]|uniref:helix-turn-helix domain-containing protein n=1 Tax=Thiothrix nivea TaxID=1031 RepID=UPI0009DAB3EE|nr:helix-turn-helix domain-containing protein [Thiothrix nivea]